MENFNDSNVIIALHAKVEKCLRTKKREKLRLDQVNSIYFVESKKVQVSPVRMNKLRVGFLFFFFKSVALWTVWLHYDINPFVQLSALEIKQDVKSIRTDRVRMLNNKLEDQMYVHTFSK